MCYVLVRVRVCVVIVIVTVTVLRYVGCMQEGDDEGVKWVAEEMKALGYASSSTLQLQSARGCIHDVSKRILTEVRLDALACNEKGFMQAVHVINSS